ncbi:cobalt/nickel transport system permease protein [Malonomonas rubra DSM 5091]|uniref:Cobalt/nickel transport system permease protein n=1 Tax=Malonomonas rubra DSM 5091 TaxID=1122189 RepID=A0A1M6E331_MALRU|nr:cobalt ECF transporter T component CbiQ [Malonomonas rubra]SHI79944.1 cobalt/nickel transport system permease protein [Malonomonas rubra DSM 5091]
MLDGQIVQLPASILFAALAVLFLCWFFACRALRRLLSTAQPVAEERDWSVPTIDADFTGDSLFHRWDVRFKLVALLGFAILVVATRSPWSALLACGFSLAAIATAKLPFLRSLRRLMAISGFVSMFLLLMPLTLATRPDDTLLMFSDIDWLRFNLRGLGLALSIAGKACAVTLLMEPLLATSSLPRTVEGLVKLGVPEKVAQMILLSHRYIFVFLEETKRMATGMQVRGFQWRSNVTTLQVAGNFLGMLFVRSFERTHRVYAAMQARGYQGRFPAPFYFKVTTGDWLHAAFWLVTGVALLCFDRFGGF